MFVTVVATLCHILAGSPDCFEEIVTDSNMTEGLTFMDCLTNGQAPLAKWKEQHPLYRTPGYTIQKYSCVQGRYELRGRA